jgi:hypothetical protein
MTRAVIKTLVLEHTTRGVRRLRGASNPDAGLVVAAVPPDLRRSYPLTWELLAGFGKQRDVSGTGRHEDMDWELVASWVLAHEVRDLVLVDAQWIPPRVFPDMIGLAAATGITLWLVAHAPLDDAYADTLNAWPTEAGHAAELASLVTRAYAPPTDPLTPDYPRLPSDSYLTFRAEARRRLLPDEFALVDGRLLEAHRRAAKWFASQPRSAVDEDSVLAYARRRLHDCASAEEMLIEIRGLQVAAHHAEWLVSADLTRLVATSQNAAAAAVHSPHTWRRLRAYRQPYRGAACALVACELALESILEVRLSDVDADGGVVEAVRTGTAEQVQLPPGAEVYLRAQVYHRQIQGAGPDDPLFATEEGPMRDRYLANAVRAAVTEVGVPLYSQQVERAEIDRKRWARRWGLAVQAL